MEGTWIGVEMLQYCPPMERLEWEEQNYMLSELFAFNEAEQSFRCYYAGEVQSIGVETKDLYIRRAALVNAIKQKRGQPIIHRAVEWLTNTGELENYQKEMDSILAEGKSLSELKKEMSDIDDERSRAFVANSLNAMQNSKKNIGFVVVGSRHEEIMRKELESRKVSYLVLAQSKIDKEDKVSKGK